MENNKGTHLAKSVLISLILAILFLVAVYVIDIILFLVIGFLVFFITKIPNIGDIFQWFMLPEDFEISLQNYTAPLLTFAIVAVLVDHFISNSSTRKYTQLFLGIGIIALNVMFFIINLISGANVLTNIAFVIFGIAFIVRSKK